MEDAGKLQVGPAEWAMLAALALLWAGSFVFYKILVAALPPFTIVFARVLLAAAALRVVVILRGDRMPVGARAWAAFALMGTLNNVVPFSLIVYGETAVSSGVAAVLNATTPLFTALAAHFFTADERLDARRMAGLALGFCGVAVLVGPSGLFGPGGGVPGELAVLLAAALLLGWAALGERPTLPGLAGLLLIGLGLAFLRGRASARRRAGTPAARTNPGAGDFLR